MVHEEGYLEAIDYLNLAKKECFILSNYYSCEATLVSLYIMLDDFNSASTLLKKKKYQKNSWLYFYNMIYCLYIGDISRAKELNLKIQRSNKVYHQKQKAESLRIIGMIEKKVYDDKLYEETKIPFVRELCLRYKDSKK